LVAAVAGEEAAVREERRKPDKKKLSLLAGTSRVFTNALEPGFSASHIEVPDAVGLRSDS